jgi:hypothetical protein
MMRLLSLDCPAVRFSVHECPQAQRRFAGSGVPGAAGRLFPDAERRLPNAVALRPSCDGTANCLYLMEIYMAPLNAKVAIVTGAGRGIGRTTAKLFTAEAADVAVLSRTGENVDRVVVDFQAADGGALCVVCDIGDPNQIKVPVDSVVAEYGRIDILVNNALGASPVLSSILNLSAEPLWIAPRGRRAGRPVPRQQRCPFSDPIQPDS